MLVANMGLTVPHTTPYLYRSPTAVHGGYRGTMKMESAMQQACAGLSGAL